MPIMKKRFAVLFSGAIVIAMVLSLVQVSPAKAQPPIPFSESGNGTITGDIVCEGFEVLEEFQYHGEGWTFLDQDGHPIRSWVRETITERITRVGYDTPELTGSSTFSGGYYYDELGNVIRAWGAGTYFVIHIPMPGYGLVLRNVGYVEADYTTNAFVWRGHWDWYDGDSEAVCAYFSGQ
jgi:hypothetical protein